MSSNVYQKLQAARILLQKKTLKKSGKNKFAGYEYFELQDFLPAVQEIFSEVGLCPIYRVHETEATLTIVNTEKPDDFVMFKAPMAGAELKGCHPVQNLGASISYLRRYLYVNALEIVEHDALDATTGKEPVPVPKPKFVPERVTTTVVGTTVTGNPIIKAANLPQEDWEMKVSGEPGSADWMQVIEQAADVLLGLAEKESDVMAIYKRNKQIFEDVKSHDAVFFKDLMDKFSATKKKFAEAV